MLIRKEFTIHHHDIVRDFFPFFPTAIFLGYCYSCYHILGVDSRYLNLLICYDCMQKLKLSLLLKLIQESILGKESNMLNDQNYDNAHFICLLMAVIFENKQGIKDNSYLIAFIAVKIFDFCFFFLSPLFIDF